MTKAELMREASALLAELEATAVKVPAGDFAPNTEHPDVSEVDELLESLRPPSVPSDSSRNSGPPSREKDGRSGVVLYTTSAVVSAYGSGVEGTGADSSAVKFKVPNRITEPGGGGGHRRSTNTNFAGLPGEPASAPGTRKSTPGVALRPTHHHRSLLEEAALEAGLHAAQPEDPWEKLQHLYNGDDQHLHQPWRGPADGVEIILEQSLKSASSRAEMRHVVSAYQGPLQKSPSLQHEYPAQRKGHWGDGNMESAGTLMLGHQPRATYSSQQQQRPSYSVQQQRQPQQQPPAYGRPVSGQQQRLLPPTYTEQQLQQRLRFVAQQKSLNERVSPRYVSEFSEDGQPLQVNDLRAESIEDLDDIDHLMPPSYR